MTATALLGYLFVVICVISTLYAAISRDLLRVSIAFFVELSSVGVVLLTLNADYLALIIFAIGLMGTILVIAFSSVIMGSLKDSFLSELETSRTKRLPRAVGMLIGLGVGAAVGWAFLTAPFLDFTKQPIVSSDADVLLIGRMLLGDHLVVFELLGIMVLLVVVGAGLLLRKPENAD